MTDFLKAMPSVTRDEYLWQWTVPQIQLSLFDQTHVEYLSEKQAPIEKARRTGNVYDGAKDIANDLGMPVL